MSGFGESESLKYPYSLDDYVSEIYSLINELKINKYHVVAHSFGARVAIKLALVDDRLDKLVITGGAGLKPRRKPSYYFKVYTYKLLKKFVKEDRLKKFGSKEYQSLPSVMKKSYVKIVNEHLDSLAKKVENKALIINGSEDRETPVYMAKRYKKYLKNSKLKILKSCSHFAFIDDSFDFNLITWQFLSGE